MFIARRPKSFDRDARSPDYREIIDLIYEAALRPSLWTDVLRLITLAVPGASATLFTHERILGKPPFYHSYGDNPKFMADYVIRWADSNPVIEAVAKLLPGEVAGLASLLAYDAFKRTNFFQEWARPQGFCDVITAILEQAPKRSAFLSLIRAERHGMADDEAIRRLRLLTPHVRRAVRIGRIFGHATVERQRLRQALDDVCEPILIMDPAGAIVHANHAASQFLNRNRSIGGMVRQGANGAAGVTLNRNATHRDRDDTLFVETQDGIVYLGEILPLARSAALRLLAMRT